MSGEPLDLGARELARAIRERRLSARELMAASLERIHALNPTLNAIVSMLDDEACLALADQADRALARGGEVGPLHGLPIAFKDLEPAVGFPQTKGSPIFRDLRPTGDSVLVERLRRAGAIPIGKTNVPEFGMGSHTYNPVFGPTRNPYDTTKSAGGSSGGAAVAVRTGMLPMADGGDLGGSLRNPANFNNIVSLRPTVGVVPNAPVQLPSAFSVKGVLARSAADVAFGMSVVAGADPRDPAIAPLDPARFLRPLDRDLKGVRVAWCPDLGGLPLDPRVRAVLGAARAAVVSLGCVVEDECPDLSGADDIFLTLRRWHSFNVHGPLLASNRSQLKPEAVAEIEAGASYTGADLARALSAHVVFMEGVRRFQERYEFILCAVNQVPPFEVDLDWPKHIDGTPMDHYVSWMKSAYWISTTCRPAGSVPAGFTSDGLPVGLQVVGRQWDDVGVLQFMHAFEAATRVGGRIPPCLA